jgi:hypothetical protein
MDLTPELKQKIDKMTISELLRAWRFSKVGTNELFEGDSGVYFNDRIRTLRDQDHAAYVKASKDLGWTV